MNLNKMFHLADNNTTFRTEIVAGLTFWGGYGGNLFVGCACIVLLFTAVLHARGVRGSILLGILAATGISILLHSIFPYFPDAIAGSALVTKSMPSFFKYIGINYGKLI